MKISNCCGAVMSNMAVDMGICPDCKEHCEVEEQEPDLDSGYPYGGMVEPYDIERDEDEE